MVNLWGPGAFDSLNPSAERPPFTPDNAPGDVDDWFKDCSSSLVQDGTEWRSALLNLLIANMRAVVRRSGYPDDNTDNDLLMRAIRSQGYNAFVAGGTANALAIAPSPSFPDFARLNAVPLLIQAAAANTAAAPTLAVGALAAKALVYPDGTPLFPGDLAESRLFWAIYSTALDKFVVLSRLGGPATTPFYGMSALPGTNNIASGGTPTATITAYGAVTNQLVNSTFASGVLTIGSGDEGFFSLNAYLTTNLPKGGTSGTANPYPAVLTIDLSTDGGSSYSSIGSDQAMSGQLIFGPQLAVPVGCIPLAVGDKIKVTGGQSSGQTLNFPVNFSAAKLGK